MHRLNTARFLHALALSVAALMAVGCEHQQNMASWNMGSWDWFGTGSYNKSYDLQYPIGNTQVVHPGAVGTVNTNTQSNSYSVNRKLQYPVGRTQPVKQSTAPKFFATKPQPAPVPRRASTSSSGGTYTKRYNLQYDIGSTQGVNGHSVAPSARSSSYQRSYDLQYAIGTPQPVKKRNILQRIFDPKPKPQPIRRPPPRVTRSNNSAPAMRGTASAGTYVVRPGDTLMSIARAHYGPRGAGRYEDILRANNNLIVRPDQIVPGMRLRIP